MSPAPEGTPGDPRHRSADYLPYFLFLLILLSGAFLRLRAINQRSVWNDEGLSLAFIRLPWHQFFPALRLDVHPPLYYLLLRAWLGLSYNITSARLFSALCSIATLPLVFLIARRLVHGWFVPLLATAFLALSPQAVHYAQEIRMYALQGLIAAGMMLCALHYLETKTNFALAAAVLLAVLGCYTQYFSGVFLIGLFAVLPFIGPTKNRLLRIALAALFACLLYLPWLPTGLSHLMSNSKGGLYQSFQGGLTLSAFQTQFIEALLGLMPAFPPTVALGFVALMFALMAAGVWRLWREPLGRLFSIAFLVIPLLLSIVFQLSGGRFYPRFYVALLPAFFIPAAFVISRIPRAWQRALISIAILWVLGNSSWRVTSVDLRDVSGETSAYLLNAAPADAAIIHATAHSFWDLRAYDANPSRHLLMDRPDTPALAREIYGPGILVNGRNISRFHDVWVVYAEWSAGPPHLRQQLEPLYFPPPWHVAVQPTVFSRFVKKMEVVHYQRGG